MEIQKASPYRYLAYIASILMIIGANLPQYFETGTVNEMKAVFDVDNEGVILYVCAIIVIMIRYCKRKKYIISPLIVQIGMMVYYVIFFIKNSSFKMVHIGFILEVAAVVFLIISMFVNIEAKKEKVNDIHSHYKVVKEELYLIILMLDHTF